MSEKPQYKCHLCDQYYYHQSSLCRHRKACAKKEHKRYEIVTKKINDLQQIVSNVQTQLELNNHVSSNAIQPLAAQQPETDNKQPIIEQINSNNKQPTVEQKSANNIDIQTIINGLDFVDYVSLRNYGSEIPLGTLITGLSGISEHLCLFLHGKVYPPHPDVNDNMWHFRTQNNEVINDKSGLKLMKKYMGGVMKCIYSYYARSPEYNLTAFEQLSAIANFSTDILCGDYERHHVNIASLLKPTQYKYHEPATHLEHVLNPAQHIQESELGVVVDERTENEKHVAQPAETVVVNERSEEIAARKRPNNELLYVQQSKKSNITSEHPIDKHTESETEYIHQNIATMKTVKLYWDL